MSKRLFFTNKFGSKVGFDVENNAGLERVLGELVESGELIPIVVAPVSTKKPAPKKA